MKMPRYLFMLVSMAIIVFMAPLCQPKNQDLDSDSDGYTTAQGDCDDQDATVFPGAYELCDQKDNDCNGTIDDGECSGKDDPTLNMDQDHDGVTPKQGDCDDHNPKVYPAAPELCDGIDNDCDQYIDDSEACKHPEDFDWDGYSPVNGDCNDNDPTARPGFSEICHDYKDNNCDGRVDENGCQVDDTFVRYYASGSILEVVGCSGNCAYELHFWLDAKIKNVAYEKGVWIEVATKDDWSDTSRYSLVYEIGLEDGYERWGVDIHDLCNRVGSTYGWQGSCVDNLYRYKIYYQVNGQTYWDDNSGKGYPINAQYYKNPY
jgi:hypothetical protein